MIKIENVEVSGWKAAIRGMRNPLNSWDKSDTDFTTFDNPIIGPNDWKLMTQLVEAGTDHSKFMRMIIFSCDITAPLFWWKEMDTYKVGSVRNSCSTMHKIMEHEFTKNDFSFESSADFESRDIAMNTVIEHLNELRDIYLYGDVEYFEDLEHNISETVYYTEPHDKRVWKELIEFLPSSYLQRATWQANYQVLRNIYHSRKSHKLSEWHDFCEMIETLPHHELITGKLVTE
jgi:hypothetical protein